MEVLPSTKNMTSHRLRPFVKPTVWHEFNALVAKFGAINLGQGFPNWETPDFIKDAAAKSVRDGNNQYCRSAGLPSLVNAIANKYSTKLNRELDAMANIAVTVGVSGGLYSSMMALLNPGDEVIVVEPAFDIYIPQILMAGGIIKYIPLRQKPESTESSRDFYLDMDEFETLFTPRTKMFVLNNPHNPLGKVFDSTELSAIAEVLKKHDKVICLSDEVYEHIVFPDDGNEENLSPNAKEVEFVHMAQIPGMWDRTVTFISAGKTFSVTGWKLGWGIGPESLIQAINAMNVWVQFCFSTPLQHALSEALPKAEEPYRGFSSYYSWLQTEYSRKRKLLLQYLKKAGLTAYAPQGSFFICVDVTNIEIPAEYLEVEETTRDVAFCRWITEKLGVSAIPVSVFFSAEHKSLGSNLVRFAFCKEDSTLEEAGQRLLQLTKHIVH